MRHTPSQSPDPPPPQGDGDEVASGVAKVMRRLVPFLLLMYVLAFLDRVNVGFAQESFLLGAGLTAALRIWHRPVPTGTAPRTPKETT